MDTWAKLIVTYKINTFVIDTWITEKEVQNGMQLNQISTYSDKRLNMFTIYIK